MIPSPSILVAGVGNVFMRDDGIGVWTAREMAQAPIPGVLVAEIGTAALHGLSLMEGMERVLVIDAAEGGGAPGTLYLFDDDKDARNDSAALFSSPKGGGCLTFQGRGTRSSPLHAMGLREALRFLPPQFIPPRITVLGIEPERVEWGMTLTDCLQKAMPRAVAMARTIVNEWLAAANAVMPDAFSNTTSSHSLSSFAIP